MKELNELNIAVMVRGCENERDIPYRGLILCGSIDVVRDVTTHITNISPRFTTTRLSSRDSLIKFENGSVIEIVQNRNPRFFRHSYSDILINSKAFEKDDVFWQRYIGAGLKSNHVSATQKEIESERCVTEVGLADNYEPSSELSDFLKTFKISENNI